MALGAVPRQSLRFLRVALVVPCHSPRFRPRQLLGLNAQKQQQAMVSARACLSAVAVSWEELEA